MRIFLIFLNLITSYCYAQWNLFYENTSTEFYVDYSSIYRQNTNATIWILTNRKNNITSSRKNTILSKKFFYEFDCASNLIKIKFFSLYDDYMGNGDRIYSKSLEDNWEPLAPGDYTNEIAILACGPS